MLGHMFSIREISGKLHERIFVQGNGGTVRMKGSHERMLTCIERATEGKDTGLYEIRLGIVLGFNETIQGRTNEREIDLCGAVIVESIPPAEFDDFKIRTHVDSKTGMKHLFITGNFDKP